MLGLTGCIDAPITVTGSGTTAVTVTWSGTASSQLVEAYPFPVGDLLILCSAEAEVCNQENGLYFDFLADGSTSRELTAGTMVYKFGTEFTPLPPGTYLLLAVSATPGVDEGSPTPGLVGVPTIFTLADNARDMTVWWHSIGRESSSSTCPHGWRPGWAQWPDESAGGYVCNRQTYSYYPDLAVPDPSWVPEDAQWLRAVSRASADTACPDGFVGSWAQWPNNGTGGHVCNEQSDSSPSSGEAPPGLTGTQASLGVTAMQDMPDGFRNILDKALSTMREFMATNGK